MATYQDITISNVHWLLENKSCIVVDIRDEDSFRQGHLPRAVRFNNQFFQQFKKHGQQQTPVLIYCYHGMTSKDVAQVFCDFGCTNVYSLEGGYAAWEATNLAIYTAKHTKKLTRYWFSMIVCLNTVKNYIS